MNTLQMHLYCPSTFGRNSPRNFFLAPRGGVINGHFTKNYAPLCCSRRADFCAERALQVSINKV